MTLRNVLPRLIMIDDLGPARQCSENPDCGKSENDETDDAIDPIPDQLIR